jgi:DNA-binding MarR family transcriptional regulator
MDLDDKKTRRQIGLNCACFNLRRAARLVTQKYDQAMRKAGLTANQLPILMSSYEDGGINMSKLAKILGMERTTLTRNIAVLERAGLLDVTSGQDKRERRVTITPKGKAKLKYAMPLWQQTQDELSSLVGEEQWKTLLAGLRDVSRKV